MLKAKPVIFLTLAILSSVLIVFPSTVSGATWSPSTAITNDSIIRFAPSAVQDGKGAVYLFWYQNPGINYIITNTSNIARGFWPSSTPYTQNLQSYTPTIVALKNGTLIMFYASLESGNWDIFVARYNNGQWSPEARFTNNVAPDQNPTALQDSTGKLWVAWDRQEIGDIKIKFVDSNVNGVWDLGEPIVYDTNSNGVYDTGEPVIYGPTPSAGSALQSDQRVQFIDSNDDGIWNPGEFVVFDQNLNALFDPRIRFVDTNNNDAWDPGEPMIYDANSDGVYSSHPGILNCVGTSLAQDCVMAGIQPANQTLLKTDLNIKFVDKSGDGVWEPGETLVSDSNKNGVYDTGEQAIVGLLNDPKFEFVGSGSAWAPGNAVVYDNNGNGVFDSKIKFVDSNNNGVWDKGETVVYDNNLNGLYDLSDTPIFESVPSADLGKQLKNDPGLRFLDSNQNGAWDQGEAVVYDSNLNSVYDGRLKFVDSNGNGVWDPGETIVYDTNNNGQYDPKLRFSDTNGNGVWDPGEPVIYDSNMNGLYDPGEPVVSIPNPMLKTDSLIKYVDSNSNNVWDQGETVVYDTNNNTLYDSSKNSKDIIIAGATPANDTALKIDSKIKFVDAGKLNGVWDPGETVVYDSNNDGQFNTGEPVIAIAISTLKVDNKVKYVDSNGDYLWNAGETVVYDSDGNGMLNQGRYHNDTIVTGPTPANNTIVKNDEAVVVGTIPSVGAPLRLDPNIKFVDRNGNRLYDLGEQVVYDTNSNNVYDSGETVILGPAPATGTGLTTGIGETVVAQGSPPIGTLLKTDPKVKYVESDGNTVWDPGEDIIYDVNNTGVYNPADPVVLSNGTLPAPGVTLSTDPKLKYADSNNNNVWDSAESVVYDENLNNQFDIGEFVVVGTIPQAGNPLANSPGEPVLSGPTPSAATALKSDPKIRYEDLNGNGHWDQGEPVEYDTNGNIVSDSGDIILYGTPAVPTPGTPLQVDEFTLAGITASPNTLLVRDSKVKFVDANGNNVWDQGETVVYDSDNNGIFNRGRFNNDTVIAGPVPANNTSVKVDSLLKYSDSNGNNVWDHGENVLYDANNNTRYDSGEPIIAIFQTPSVGALLKSDPHIKYFETGSDHNWDVGESVVYDTNGNGVYDIGEPTIAGQTPAPTTPLSTDSNIKFADSNNNGTWEKGEAVVYDSNNNGKYDLGEYAIADGPPEGGTQVRQVTHLFYKMYNGTSWTPSQRLTTQPSNDHTASLGQTEDGRIWVTWAGDRSGIGEILYKTSLDGTTWTPEQPLSSSSLGDKDPTMIQDRNGTIWVTFARNVPCSCGQGVTFEVDLYYLYSNDNGATWTSAAPFMTTTGSDEIEPTMAQFSDEKLYVFYSNVVCGSTTCTSNLSYMSSLIQMHAAKNNGLTASTSSLRVGQTLNVRVNVTNTGDYNDIFTVTLKVNNTLVATNSTMVNTGQTIQVVLNWIAGGITPGHYLLSANISDPGESLANQVDNTANLPGLLTIRPAGDVNGDCTVNIVDLVLVAGSFGKSVGNPGYNPASDLNGDGTVNITDLSIVGSTFGKHC